MVQELMVECPHCRQVAEIFLSTNACVIILNCPSCSSPIMYFDHKIFILTPQQLQTIKNKSKGSPSLNTLRNMFQQEQLPVKKQGCQLNTQHILLPHTTTPAWANASEYADPFEINIVDDDITNLKIDLAMCRDVLDFVATA